MTLAELNERMALGVNRSDLAAAYTNFLNEAQREICKLRSWVWMRKVATLTLAAGATSVAMPADFKELCPARSPIHYTTDDGTLTPLDLVTREQRIRRSYLYPILSVRGFLDWTTSPPSLNIYSAAEAAIDFNVSYFGYLPNLSASTDHNTLTDDYPEMLLAKAKACALLTVNDPLAGDLETVFEKKFDAARKHDAYASVAGTQLRL